MLDRHDPFGRAMGLRQVMDRLLEDAFVMPRGGEAGAMGGPALNRLRRERPAVHRSAATGHEAG
jgi:hypothetical protein